MSIAEQVNQFWYAPFVLLVAAAALVDGLVFFSNDSRLEAFPRALRWIGRVSIVAWLALAVLIAVVINDATGVGPTSVDVGPIGSIIGGLVIAAVLMVPLLVIGTGVLSLLVWLRRPMWVSVAVAVVASPILAAVALAIPRLLGDALAPTL